MSDSSPEVRVTSAVGVAASAGTECLAGGGSGISGGRNVSWDDGDGKSAALSPAGEDGAEVSDSSGGPGSAVSWLKLNHRPIHSAAAGTRTTAKRRIMGMPSHPPPPADGGASGGHTKVACGGRRSTGRGGSGLMVGLEHKCATRRSCIVNPNILDSLWQMTTADRAVLLRTPTCWSYYATTLLRTPGRSNLLRTGVRSNVVT